ncbi:MAG: hypothetical protein JWQ93_1709 [Marmoricola sp.]|nr:hypothetical protein [Marmoricola sp.]
MGRHGGRDDVKGVQPRAAAGQAGSVDQAVDPTEPLDRLTDGLARLLDVGDVRRHEANVVAIERTKLGGRSLTHVDAPACDDDTRTGKERCAGHRGTYSLGAAADQDDLVLQIAGSRSVDVQRISSLLRRAA